MFVVLRFPHLVLTHVGHNKGPTLCQSPQIVQHVGCEQSTVGGEALNISHGLAATGAEDLHIAVVALMREVIPAGAKVVFLGDGEFDGTALQATLNEAGWCYACRTAQSTVATWEGETFRLDTLGACSKPGTLIALQEVKFTRDAYGPVMVLSCWAKGYQDPLYLVSNMDTAEEACRYYQKRFRIETFFADQKSRGFHLHKSHIADPQRLSRLLIAACLAYIWIIYLGSLCEKEGWRSVIHRRDRCDLSLFQLGLRLLDNFLNEDLPIPIAFHVTI